VDGAKSQKKVLFRQFRWRDVIVISLGIVLGWSIHIYRARQLKPFTSLTDYQKWQARPQLVSQVTQGVNPSQARNGNMPCLFIVPSGAVNQPIVSGSVGECLWMVPDGRKLDLIQVGLVTFVVPVKTDLYVEDSLPLAFTRTYFPPSDWSTKYPIFLPHVYDPYLTGSRYPYTFLDWRLPDGQSIHYERISPGTGFADAVYQSAGPGLIFTGSRVAWNGWG
jgi:hypothetical protein